MRFEQAVELFQEPVCILYHMEQIQGVDDISCLGRNIHRFPIRLDRFNILIYFAMTSLMVEAGNDGAVRLQKYIPAGKP